MMREVGRTSQRVRALWHGCVRKHGLVGGRGLPCSSAGVDPVTNHAVIPGSPTEPGLRRRAERTTKPGKSHQSRVFPDSDRVSSGDAPIMRVSIVISTYNLESYVAETLDAALAQTHPTCEVIVVDDGSTDGTREILSRYDDRVRVILQENSGGPSGPRNVGIRASTGDLVALCDGDDVLRPDAVEKSVEVLRNDSRVDLVWADLEYLRGGDVLGRWSERYTDFRSDLEPSGHPGYRHLPSAKAYEWLLAGLFLGTSSVVVRREALDAVGPFDESLANGDDRDMWLRLARTGHDFAYRDEVAYAYRLREDGLTRRGYQRMPAVISVLERQFPHVREPGLRRIVSSRLNETRSGYAVGLRKDGRYVEASRVYWHLLRTGAITTGLRGLLLSMLGIRGRDPR